MNENQHACFFYPATHAVRRPGCSHICDVSRAAGGRADGAGHHSSYQDVEPISPTLRDHAHTDLALPKPLSVSPSPYKYSF